MLNQGTTQTLPPLVARVNYPLSGVITSPRPLGGDLLIGNNLPSRMVNYGYFESEIYLRFPDNDLIIRNMGDGGNTPGFRPHAGRKTSWAFPGAEKFHTELAQPSGSTGHFEYPDQWLTKYHADIILCFGFSESFSGPAGIANYANELQAFIDHSLSQKYNGSFGPQIGIGFSNSIRRPFCQDGCAVW